MDFPWNDSFGVFSHYDIENFSIDLPTQTVLGKDVDVYLTLGFIIIGTLGNILSIVAVTSRHSKKSSFTVYVFALAVIDTLALYTINAQKLIQEIFGITAINHNVVLCKLIRYLEEAVPHISSWFVVCLTVERCLCITFPHKSALMNRPKTGYIVVSSVSTCLIVLNLHLLYGHEFLHLSGSTYACTFNDPIYNEFYSNYWNWITLLVYCGLPFIIIATANTVTVVQVYRSSRLVSTASALASRRNRQLILIALLVSVSFVLLGMPQPMLDVIRLEQEGDGLDVDVRVSKTAILFTFFNHMRTLNHAINFFLYVLSGRRFRQDLKAAFVNTCCSSI